MVGATAGGAYSETKTKQQTPEQRDIALLTGGGNDAIHSQLTPRSVCINMLTN